MTMMIADDCSRTSNGSLSGPDGVEEFFCRHLISDPVDRL